MPNTNLVQLIKKCAMDVFWASNPCDWQIAKVNSASPLKISLSQSLVLDSDFLVVPERLKNTLQTGDTVILLRKSGGQAFLVMDKAVSADDS